MTAAAAAAESGSNSIATDLHVMESHIKKISSRAVANHRILTHLDFRRREARHRQLLRFFLGLILLKLESKVFEV